MVSLLFIREVLLHLWFIFAFAIIVTVLSLIGFLFGQNKLFGFMFIVFSFSILGLVTGSIMSDSQEPAVTAVLPATLTLLGGLGAYIIGFTDAGKQSVTSSIVFCFAISLFVGSIYASWIRDDIKFSYEDNEELRNTLQYQSDLDRIGKYVDIIRLKQDFEKKYNIDLSGFASYFELQEKTDENNTSQGERPGKTKEVK